MQTIKHQAMYQIGKQVHFCYGHRLLNYQGKCQYLHGHNALAEIKLAADKLDGRGILVDFGDIKKTLGDWIDTHLDHQTLLQRNDPLVPILQKADQKIFLMDENPTAENIAKLLVEKARQLGLPVVAIKLWETADSYASWTQPVR